jgi:hypothetical protein
MDINSLKISIMNYLTHFTMYDYMAYSWLILIFFVSLLLSIFLAKKSAVFSVLILLISLSLLFAGPFMIKNYLDKQLRANETKTTMIKKLNFSDAMIVEGEVKNLSKNTFTICSVEISILKIDAGFFQNFKNQLKPLMKQTISVNNPIDINMSEKFRVVFDGYTYNEDVNVSVKSNCY